LEQLRSTVSHSRLLADLPKYPPIRQAEQFAASSAAMPLSQRLLVCSCRNLGVGLCLEEQFGAAASASGEKLLESAATGLDTAALSADRTILQPPPPVVYCSRWIEQRWWQSSAEVFEACGPGTFHRPRKRCVASCGPFGPRAFHTGPPDNSPSRETHRGTCHLITAATETQPWMCRELPGKVPSPRDRKNAPKQEGLRLRTICIPVGDDIAGANALWTPN